MRILLIIFITVVLSACSSVYTPSDNFDIYKKAMGKEQAKLIFYSIINPSNAAIGICSKYGIDKLSKFEPTSDGFKYRAWKSGDYIGDEKRYGIDYKLYKKDYFIETVKFADIEKARLLRGITCTEGKGDHSVLLYTSFTNYLQVDIPPDTLEKFMAAMSILSPDTKLIEGVGL